MIDIKLRTNDEQEMDDALVSAGIGQQITVLENLQIIKPVDGVTIDRIGPCGADTRYHANVRISDGVVYDADELPTFTPLPVTPYRVWFDG